MTDNQTTLENDNATRQSVLNQWQTAQSWLKPIGMNNLFFADVRLTVLRAPYTSVLLFEYVAFSVPDAECIHGVDAFGECFPDWFYTFNRTPLAQDPENMLWDLDTGKWVGDIREFSVLLYGEKRHFCPTEDELAAARFDNDLCNKFEEMRPLYLLKLLVSLSAVQSMKQEQLYTLMNVALYGQQHDPHSFRTLLQTKDWMHPCYVDGQDESTEWPNECFQALADCVVSNDTVAWTEWIQSHPTKINTIWEIFEEAALADACQGNRTALAEYAQKKKTGANPVRVRSR